MLPSGNEAANTLARFVGGSIPEFVKKMNARATDLGCPDTHFVNPNSLRDRQIIIPLRPTICSHGQSDENETFAMIADARRKI